MSTISIVGMLGGIIFGTALALIQHAKITGPINRCNAGDEIACIILSTQRQ